MILNVSKNVDEQIQAVPLFLEVFLFKHTLVLTRKCLVKVVLFVVVGFFLVGSKKNISLFFPIFGLVRSS